LIIGEYDEPPPVSGELSPMLVVISSEDVVVDKHTAKAAPTYSLAARTFNLHCRRGNRCHHRGNSIQVVDDPSGFGGCRLTSLNVCPSENARRTQRIAPSSIQAT
jgi:hypothetical protein